MKLNTTSQHAIRIMTYIAKTSEKKFHRAKEISEILDIPYKYLSKIMTELATANILTSVQGREGGYFMSKEAKDISVKDILESVKEPTHATQCLLGTDNCDENKKCFLHDKWTEPKKSILDMFTNTTLEDIKKDDYKI